jgi:uncharacterized protein YozE (UPF0346 family)
MALIGAFCAANNRENSVNPHPAQIATSEEYSSSLLDNAAGPIAVSAVAGISSRNSGSVVAGRTLNNPASVQKYLDSLHRMPLSYQDALAGAMRGKGAYALLLTYDGGKIALKRVERADNIYPDKNVPKGTFTYKIISREGDVLYSARFIDPGLTTISPSGIAMTPPEGYVKGGELPPSGSAKAGPTELSIIAPCFLNGKDIEIDGPNGKKTAIDVSKYALRTKINKKPPATKAEIKKTDGSFVVTGYVYQPREVHYVKLRVQRNGNVDSLADYPVYAALHNKWQLHKNPVK